MMFFKSLCPRNVFLFLFFVFMYATVIPVSCADELPEVIRICNDGEWAPYSYKDPRNEERGIGISVDILHEILRRRNLKTEITIFPWKRCMYKVEKGEYQIITDSSRNSERERKYLISDPLYEVHHAFYYDKTRYPDGPGIRTVEDVNSFSVGAIFGYDLDMYKFDITKIDSGTKNIDSLLKKLRHKYIDLAIGYVEVCQALAAMGKIDMTGLGRMEIPETSSHIYHVMFTRGKGGEELLEIFNKGLKQLKSEGYYQKVFQKYGIPLE
ncbi:transporter substrate-binding domain-containing protein [Desulfobacterales bacterium HSG2]|nr:transporter substrate-binding domain-containing protein [Desulfobacterales bacterium HSG2]